MTTIAAVFPNVAPRLIVRAGLLALLAGAVVPLGKLAPASGPEIVLVPMLLIGLGIGALASQLGAVTTGSDDVPLARLSGSPATSAICVRVSASTWVKRPPAGVPRGRLAYRRGVRAIPTCDRVERGALQPHAGGG